MRFLIVILCILLIVLAVPAAAQSPNLLQNPGFDSEMYTLISQDPLDPATWYNAPQGWWGGIITAPHDASWQNVHPSGYPHSAFLKRSGIFSFNMARGGGTFTAYIYQHVPVVPDTDVQGGAWAYLENDVTSSVRVGIDPFGGADPGSPNVVWSGWSGSLRQWNYLNVVTKSKAGTVTLFLYATQAQPANPNGVYWDEAFLFGTPGTAPAAPAASSAPTGQVVTAGISRVNVRSGAGTTFERIGQINPGESYPLIEQTGDWYKIDFKGQVGYVSAGFVTVSGGALSAPASEPAAAPADALQFTALYTVRLRSAPDTNAETLTRIPFNAIAQAIGRTADNAWVQLVYEGQTGWAAVRFGRLNDNIERLAVK